jgi:hypothetical protein
MRRFSLPLSLLLAAGATLTACSDRPALPTAPADSRLALDRRSDEAEDAIVVRGTGHPEIDVPAVQAAVDRGGDVLLVGDFDFDAPPNPLNGVATALVTAGMPAHAEVKITNAVRVSGIEGHGEQMTTIRDGTLPFYVEAPGQAVTIRRLRFVRPKSHAIVVFAVRGLEIVSNKIEGLETFSPNLNGAVGIFTNSAIPNPTKPGNPSNVSGTLVIAHNDFDVVGGTATDNVLGVTVFSVGDSATPVDVRVSGNTIRNTTEPAINFRRAVGRVSIDHNTIITGPIGVAGARAQVIRVANLGSYRIAHNSIECDWAVPDAEAIGVFSQFAAWSIDDAIVEHNDITMAPPAGTSFTAFSAAIGVYGFARYNVVRHNRIHGRALAGISIPLFPLPPATAATPQENAFIRNEFRGFTPSVGNYVVDASAVGTRIVLARNGR